MAVKKKKPAKSTWTGAERRVAEKLGTKRTPLSGGSSRHTRSDTLHPKLFVETKHSMRYSTLVAKLWKRVEADVTATEVPLVCLLASEDEKAEDMISALSNGWLIWHEKHDSALAARLDWEKNPNSTAVPCRQYITLCYRHNPAVINLWKTAAELARAEEKIPVLAIFEKYKRGWWWMAHYNDYEVVLSEIKKTMEV